MSTLKRQESTEDGCGRMVCESIELAIRELTRKDGSDATAADAMRRADAGIALIESDLPREIARRDRRLLERIALEISAAQRPGEMLAQLDRMAGKAGMTLDDSQAKAFRKALVRQHGTGLSMNTPNRSFDPVVYRLVADLAELRGHVGEWPTFEPDPAKPPAGLRRAYNAARRAVLEPLASTAQTEIAIGYLHTLALQLVFLNRCCPAMLKPQRKLLLATVKLLDQRATQLRLVEMLDTEDNRGWAEPLLQQARDSETASAGTSLLGSALAESPTAFMNRIAAYWRHWRKA